MKLKLAPLAAALTSALALGASGQAMASVYAGSSLLTQNMHLAIFDAATQQAAPQPFNSFQFTITNTATLNGASAAANTNTCGGTPVGNDCGVAPKLQTLTAANAPGSTWLRANNDYAFHGTSSDQYSSSDSVIDTAQVTGNFASATRQIAESELQGGRTASSNSEIQSTTGFIFNFTLQQIGALSFEFEADPAMRVAINQPAPYHGFSSQANLNATITLTNDATGDSITWSPQGSVANNCDVDAGLAGAGVVCFEGRFDLANPDGEDLNRNLSSSTNGSDINHSLAAGWATFGVKMIGLAAGDWTLSLNSVTSTQMRQVPEPETLALLGLGLLGMGLAKRRKA